MKSTTIRIIIITSLLAAAGIILTQIFWVRRAYVLNEQTFEQRALAALSGAAQEVRLQGHPAAADYDLIEKVTPSYFVAETTEPVDKEVLQKYLSKHLLIQQLPARFAFLHYNCQKNAADYFGTVGTGIAGSEDGEWLPEAPSLRSNSNYYFGVFFPHRQQLLLSELSPWIWSSMGLLVILGVLGYLLLTVFRQKQLTEVQKDFVSNMTHEFKTPLSAIQLSADVLKNPNIISQPQRLQNYATIISNESRQLAAHVARLLEAGEQDHGVLIEQQEFCWQELIEDVRQTFLDNWKQPDCVPVVKLNMPEAPVSFRGDKKRLAIALTNLLENAALYCKQTPEIEITLQVQRKHISLAIRDNGIGIAKEHQRMLFKKFYRVPNGKLHDYKGFGLGLNYVRQIVKGHGGQVDCNSQQGKGSIFTLSFPVKNPRHYERNQSKHPVSGR